MEAATRMSLIVSSTYVLNYPSGAGDIQLNFKDFENDEGIWTV